MKFRTEFISRKSLPALNPAKPVVLLGSCFSTNMASKMNSHAWKALNPAGTLYNPTSIATALRLMLDFQEGSYHFHDSLFLANGIWNSHFFDSSFSSPHKEDCLEEFKNRSIVLSETLTEGGTLIVTFGTSIVYYLAKSGVAVGNCHKQPASHYVRRRLAVKEITDEWHRIIGLLKKRFPDINIIFTVSPVRHLKDGFEGNARSKAILLLAVEELCSFFPVDCRYFPAYEIMLDDLRDYRFYASDLVHPSDQAIEYIWEKFTETFIDEPGEKLLEEGAKKYKASHHIPKTGALGVTLSKVSDS